MHPKPECLRILVAEDEPLLGEILGQWLRGWGHEVVWAANGRAAWRESVRRPFDVLITDHRMPEMDGLALVTQLRGQDFRGRIIVHSSHLPASAATSYQHLGVGTFLAKPTSSGALQRVLTA